MTKIEKAEANLRNLIAIRNEAITLMVNYQAKHNKKLKQDLPDQPLLLEYLKTSNKHWTKLLGQAYLDKEKVMSLMTEYQIDFHYASK